MMAIRFYRATLRAMKTFAKNGVDQRDSFGISLCVVAGMVIGINFNERAA
jgi:hypothetical protein